MDDIKIKTVVLAVIFVFSLIVPVQGEEGVPDPDITIYEYQQTKDLVSFVHEAAGLFSEKGEKAFPDFQKKGSKWFNERRYLFIYDLKGVNVFHPVEPELEGKDLIGLKDLDGKPVIRYLIETVTEKDEPYGWIHYLWCEPGEIFPRWKSSYVLKAEDPSGKEYVIGSGIYNMRPERRFMVDAVDSAAELIKKKGKGAFKEIGAKSSRFVFRDTYIFVLSMDGKAVVDPAFPSEEGARDIKVGRELIDFQDVVGKYAVQEMIDKLKQSDSAWVMYMWPKIGETTPSKKAAYVRKVKVDGEEYIVGSDIFLANPIWMKL